MLRRIGIIGLGGPLLAVVGVLIYLYVFGETEPTFEDATTQLVGAHTVYALDREGRPAALVAPFNADPSSPLPLVIVLHGYASNVWADAQYLGLIARVQMDRIMLLLPSGTRDEEGNRFWNATDFCCDFGRSGIDDVAYVAALVEEASQLVEIDGVYVVGYGNGAFMAYRLACESLPALIGIVAVAGSSFTDETRCDEAVPVSTLHIHGTADDVFLYEGGEMGEYPYAQGVTFRWARRAGCDFTSPEILPSLDLLPDIAGTETRVFRYRAGCRDGVTVEHWLIHPGAHAPDFASGAPGIQIVDWLLKEARAS